MKTLHSGLGGMIIKEQDPERYQFIPSTMLAFKVESSIKMG